MTTGENDPMKDRDEAAEEDEEEEEEEDEEDEEEVSFYESGSSHSGEVETWISSFCSLSGHEYFAEVSEDFIEDDFNLTGLNSVVPYYKEALDMILDFDSEPADTVRLSNIPIIENSAELLYGLIHARFLLSRPGLQIMAEKYDLQHFGTCPRYYCNQTPVLPLGKTDRPGEDTVKLFCPSCGDIYVPPNSRFQTVDGAYFGTSFPGLFFKTFTEIPKVLSLSIYRSPSLDNASSRSGSSTSSKTSGGGAAANALKNRDGVFEMKIYGFRVAEKARSGPRMKWLRMKPASVAELDEYERRTRALLAKDDSPDKMSISTDAPPSPISIDTQPSMSRLSTGNRSEDHPMAG
ncbi:casein kinase II subunit beta-1 [Dipodascopsis tothii]|uniref:casein kinase II subunit beta-1 n=1 Tax=Dipodascopsis tothii TaxID=44089 RepID=UPI0034CD7530